MISRLFLICISIALSIQGQDVRLEGNAVEKAEGIEIAYEYLTSAEIRKQDRKSAFRQPIASFPEVKKIYRLLIKEETFSHLRLHLQYRSLRI
jgi:hypothetical protein